MRSCTAVRPYAVLWLGLLTYAGSVSLSQTGSRARADEFYVAPDGNDAAPGTMESPFGTVDRAQQAAMPGDTVWIRGGEYHFSGTNRTVGVAFTKSGTPDNPIRYFAYADEVPIFDLFDVRPQERVTGLDVRCNAIHLRGLEVRGVRQLIVGDSWGVRIRGDNNVIERLHVHDCEAPGVFITSGASNLILNCDSHHNYDPLEDGGNADGFGCHSEGGNNVLRGCRAWDNSDDGFDFINAPGTCTVEQSWAFRNGYVPDTKTGAGNGAGFKSGGFGSPPRIPSSGVPRHVVRFNLAFRNRAQGFYANHHPGGLDFFNNTAFGNGVNFDMLVEGGRSTHELHNNLAVEPGGTIMRFTGGDDSVNSWSLPVMVSSDDFVSMDEAQATAPRQADGSLPDIGFMHLADGSDLIDSGTDVGQPFGGSAPDLGAFEHGLATTTDTDTDTDTSGDTAEPETNEPQNPGMTEGPEDSAGAGVPPSSSGAGASAEAGHAAAGASGRLTHAAGASGGTAAGSPAGNAAPSQSVQTTQAVQSEPLTESSPDESSGCSCQIGGRPRRVPAAAYLLPAVAWLGTRRRRKRSARRPQAHDEISP